MRWTCGLKLCVKQSIMSLHTKNNVKDIIPIIKLKKLQWFGHLKQSRHLRDWLKGKESKEDLVGDGEMTFWSGVGNASVWRKLEG